MNGSWRQVIGYEQIYEVSDHGEVRRVARASGAKIGKVLKSWIAKDGYLAVKLSSHSQTRTWPVHILVVRAFLEAQPSPSHEVNHKDSDRQNPFSDNLEWVTRSGNMQHAVKMNGFKPITASRNAQKTHCSRGHPLNGENLTIRPNGGRRCKACEAEGARRRRAA